MTASRPAFRRLAILALASVVAALAVGSLGEQDAHAAPIRSVNPNALSNNIDTVSRIIVETTNSYSPANTKVRFTRVDQASGQTAEFFDGTVIIPQSGGAITPTNRFEVDVNPFNRNPGTYNIQVSGSVTTVSGVIVLVESDNCARCFFILTPGSPTVTGITTPQLSAGTTVGPVTITGTNFATGSSVDFMLNGAVDPTVVFLKTSSTTTTITGNIRTASNALPGLRDIRVSNSDLQRGTCVNCVAVSGIVVTGVQPQAATNAEVRRLVITGNGFPSDARAQLIREFQTGQPSIFGGNTVVFSTGELHADFDLRGAEVGRYLIRVFGVDGQSNNIACSPRFTVASATTAGPTPSPTSTVSPSPASAGTCVGNNEPFPSPTGSAISPTPSPSPSPSESVTPTSTASTTTSASPTATPSPTPPEGVGRFVAVNPERVLDTREGLNTVRLPLSGGETRSFTVTGRAGVPTGATAVAINVTAIQPTRNGYLTVFPAGGSRPLASNLNFVPRDVIANFVIVRVGTGGQVSIFNLAGSTHVAADIVGYYGPATGGSAYSALNPDRLLDTRDGTGGSAEPISSGESRSLQVAGRSDVPLTATAVALNLTAISPSANGFLTVYPSDATRPVASNVNFTPSKTIANLTIVRLGADGKVNIFNHSGFTDVVADVVGYFSDAGGSQALYTSLIPDRIMDTRSGVGGPSSPIGPAESRELLVTGRGGVPANASAVVFNLTAISPSREGFFTAFPTGTFRPTASNINFVRGQIIPNLVIVRVGSGGKVNIYNHSGFTNAAADVVGYFVNTVNPTPSGSATATPTSTSTATPTSTSTATPTASVTATATTTATSTPSVTTTPSGSTPSTSAVAFGGTNRSDAGTNAALGMLVLVVMTGGAGFLLTPYVARNARYRRRH